MFRKFFRNILNRLMPPSPVTTESFSQAEADLLISRLDQQTKECYSGYLGVPKITPHDLQPVDAEEYDITHPTTPESIPDTAHDWETRQQEAVSQAAEAQELYGDDELEAFAESQCRAISESLQTSLTKDDPMKTTQVEVLNIPSSSGPTKISTVTLRAMPEEVFGIPESKAQTPVIPPAPLIPPAPVVPTVLTYREQMIARAKELAEENAFPRKEIRQRLEAEFGIMIGESTLRGWLKSR